MYGVIHNRCIHLFPENCNLCQIRISCNEMCSEELKCFPGNSSPGSLGSWNSNSSQIRSFWQDIYFFNGPIHHYLFKRPPTFFYESKFDISVQNFFFIWLSCKKKKYIYIYISVLMRNKGLAIPLTWSKEAWCNQI